MKEKDQNNGSADLLNLHDPIVRKELAEAFAFIIKLQISRGWGSECLYFDDNTIDPKIEQQCTVSLFVELREMHVVLCKQWRDGSIKLFYVTNFFSDLYQKDPQQIKKLLNKGIELYHGGEQESFNIFNYRVLRDRYNNQKNNARDK